MATERIESLISKEALAQFDELNAKLGMSITGFEKLVAKAVETNKALGGAKTFKQVIDGTKELEEAEKALTKQKFDLEKQQAKLNQLYSEEAKRIAELKVQQQQRNQQIKEEIQLTHASEGSIKQKQIQIKQLQREYDNLSAAEREAAKGTDLLKSIQNLDKELKELEGSTGRFQRNVGNYQGSAKIIVDALERARQKFEGLKKSADSTPAALERAKSEFEALRGVVDNKQFLNFTGKMGDATQEVRTFTRTLVNLETQGLGNSEVANELRQRLAQLTDTIADTRSEVKALASDTRSFDLFASSVSFAADVFQTAAGAAVAFGASEEDAAEATRTLLAVQNISNGVKGIANELTTKGTAANKLYEFSQRQLSTAFDSSAAAGARFRAVLVTLGIGAIVVGIGLLIANFSKLKAVFSGLSKEQQLLTEINSKATESFVKEKVAVEALVAEGQRENTSKRRKLEIIKELNEKSPVYFGHIKTEKDLQEQATEAVKKYVQAITLKARAQAAIDILTEKETKVVERQIELERQYEDVKTKNFGNEQNRQRYLAKFRELIDKGADTELQALQKQAAPVKKVVADIQAELDKLGGDPNPKNGTEQTKLQKKFYDDLLKLQVDQLKKLSENEDAHLITRLSAREKSFEIEKQILAGQQKVEIENAEGSAEKIAEINRDYGIKRKLLEQQIGLDIFNIRQSFVARQRELEQKDNEEFYKDQEDALNNQIEAIQSIQEKRLTNGISGRESELKALNIWYKNQIEATTEGSKEREKVEREYAERRADIEYSYALAAIKTQIDASKKILAAKQAAGIDVTADSKKLHELEIELSDMETNRVIANNKRQSASHEEKFQAMLAAMNTAREVFGEIENTIGAFMSASIDRETEAINDQIEALEKKKEKDIEVANAQAGTEQEKQTRIARIEQTAQAQREALERRQRELELQRARFEKSAAIARIIADTAAAVVAALGAKPFTPANIAQATLVGSIGALQLAQAIAAPLPKFATGTDDAPGGLAWVGDAYRSELMVTPKGDLVETPPVPTVMNVPKHSIIFPDSKQALRAMYEHIGLNQSPRLVDHGRYYKEMTATIGKKLDKIDKTIRGKKEVHIHRSRDGWKTITKSGGSETHYLNDNLQG